MTLDQLRNVNIAEWSAREAIARASMGEHESAAHHLGAARESLRNSEQIIVQPFWTADDIASACADIKDRVGIVA